MKSFDLANYEDVMRTVAAEAQDAITKAEALAHPDVPRQIAERVNHARTHTPRHLAVSDDELAMRLGPAVHADNNERLAAALEVVTEKITAYDAVLTRAKNSNALTIEDPIVSQTELGISSDRAIVKELRGLRQDLAISTVQARYATAAVAERWSAAVIAEDAGQLAIAAHLEALVWHEVQPQEKGKPGELVRTRPGLNEEQKRVQTAVLQRRAARFTPDANARLSKWDRVKTEFETQRGAIQGRFNTIEHGGVLGARPTAAALDGRLGHLV